MKVRRGAVVLAAGQGLRLRPLTEHVPKPLLPVAGVPIIAASLEVLRRHGVERCAINTHHLPQAIPQALGDNWRGMPLIYRHEEVLLGTLGPLVAFREDLADCDEIFVLNGDSLCDWPLAQLVDVRRRAGTRIALLLSATADREALGGGLGVDAEGMVRLVPELDLGGWVRRRVFAGAHLIDPAILAGQELQPGDSIRQLYRPLLANGERIATVTTSRRWDDLGTPETYRQGVVRRLNSRGYRSSTADVAVTARIVRSAVEAGARLGPDAVVEESVILPGARIAAGARVIRAVVGFGAEIAAGQQVEGPIL